MGDANADEMTTREAVAYLNARLGLNLRPKFMYGLRYIKRGPVAEKRGRSLVWHRESIDAFLLENGHNPLMWIAGRSRDHIESLRARGIHDPEIEQLIRDLDPDPDRLTVSDILGPVSDPGS